jgi:hypothetical protein
MARRIQHHWAQGPVASKIRTWVILEQAGHGATHSMSVSLVASPSQTWVVLQQAGHGAMHSTSMSPVASSATLQCPRMSPQAGPRRYID